MDTIMAGSFWIYIYIMDQLRKRRKKIKRYKVKEDILPSYNTKYFIRLKIQNIVNNK